MLPCDNRVPILNTGFEKTKPRRRKVAKANSKFP